MTTKHHNPKAKTPDQNVLPHHTVMALVTAADRVRRAMTQALHPFDLTVPQFNVLVILDAHAELPTFQIAARMVEATPGITRLVSTLEAKGLVNRVQSSGDRRQQLCSLTRHGREALKAVLPRIHAAQRQFLSGLSQADAARMTALLRRVSPIT